MIKKLLTLILALTPVMLSAQMASGEWYTYPTYTNNVKDMVETASGKLYFQAGSSLYSYDTDTTELYSYTKRNLLNDNEVSSIVYNYEQKYLLVIYANCNMDLIYDSGRVVNFSDIKDAIMMTDKAINDVAFYNNRIYVATSFGMVVYDDDKHHVVESGNYNRSVNSIIAAHGRILLYDGEGIYGSDCSVAHYTFDSFTRVSGPPAINAFFFNGDDDEWFYASINADKRLQRMKYFGGSALQYEYFLTNEVTVDRSYRSAGSNLNIVNKDKTIVLTVKDGAQQGYNLVNSALSGKLFTSYVNPERLWAFDSATGTGYYDLNGTAQIAPFEPEACTVERVAYLTPSPDGKRIYVSTIGPSHYKKISPNKSWTSDGDCDMPMVNVIENGSLTDVSVESAPSLQAITAKYKRVMSVDTFFGPGHVTQDVLDPDANAYYISAYAEGVYRIKDGQVTAYYNPTNSPMMARKGSNSGWGGVFCSSVNQDPDGNLWATSIDDSSTLGIQIMCLPAAKVRIPSENITAADWEVKAFHAFGDFFRDVEILCCTKSPMVYVLMGYYQTTLWVYNRQTGESQTWKNFTDQDGKSYDMTQTLTLVEDTDGSVWLSGYAKGVIRVADPTALISPSATVQRVKVPRNDGTDYADYLMETENVTKICVDPSGRKWFATDNSGLYLVKADGSEVLEQFTVENSPIPANQVNTVCADPLSNRVYVGTNYGVAVYNSNSAPAADDYSGAYAYPNPVRPDYTGWITIAGLMDASLVKIGDTMGNILCTGTSEGGMYMWDGCDSYGNRVKSGVYYVYASQSPSSAGGGTSGTIACKILVVN